MLTAVRETTIWCWTISRITVRTRPEKARRNVGPFIRKMRRIYRKAGGELKYLEVVEFGKKGGLHHHIFINACDGVEAKDYRSNWPFGRIHFHLLDDSGEYSQLASYMLKQRRYWKAAGGKGKQYSRSRNMIRPETKKEVIRAVDGYYERPRKRKGYYVKKETEVFLTTEAGWPYMRYILVKDQKRRGP